MTKYLIAFLAGAAMVVAFAPFNWVWLSFPSLAILFYLWQAASSKQSFWIGYCYGLGLFLLGISWVYISLHIYGGMPLWMGGLAVFLFASAMAMFIALQGWLLAWLFPANSWHRFAAIPFLWIIFEWCKSWFLTGFPWLDVGYSQIDTFFSSSAPVGGVYLVSLVIAVISVLLQGLFKNPCRVATVILLIGLIAASWLLDKQNWAEKSGEPINVALVQANIPIEKKWLVDYRDKVINQYRSLTHQISLQQKVDLTVWPETALPLYVQQADNNFWRTMTPETTALLTGIMDSPEPGKDYNAATLFCDNQQQIYRKRHLVPFGEYLPLRFLFNWVLDYLQLPMSDFSSWQGVQQLHCNNNINIALSICYEDAFAGEMRQYSGDATILVNISEDAWFGDSIAPHQRLQMAQMRAKELSRPLIRSANSGPSLFINERGEVEKQTAQFQVATLTHQVQPMQGQTPFKKFGNWVIALALLLVLVLVIVLRLKQKPSR